MLLVLSSKVGQSKYQICRFANKSKTAIQLKDNLQRAAKANTGYDLSRLLSLCKV